MFKFSVAYIYVDAYRRDIYGLQFLLHRIL